MNSIKRLTILIDMDDVLENLVECWVAALNRKHGTTVKPEDITNWLIGEFFPSLTKEELFALKKEIDIYFRNELKLNIKGNWQVFPSYIRGVDFLGYRTFYKYTLLRKSTCLEMEKKMTAIRNKVEAGNMMNYSEWCSINSYKGWLKYADTFRLYQKYVVPLLPYADDYYIRNIKPNTKKGLNAA